MKTLIEAMICQFLRQPKIVVHYICVARATENKAYSLQVDSGNLHVYCHRTNFGACGEGGWTLVMKIDGSKVYTFSFVLLICFFVYELFTKHTKHDCDVKRHKGLLETLKR